MRVTLAKSAGFCYGVRRAVELAREAAADGKPCVMLGPVIHNRAVIEQLQSMGVALIHTPEEAPPGSRVILRSHGEGQATFAALERRGVDIMDTTCPNVSRIHRLVRQAGEEDRRVIIIGGAGHPEVQAIAGWSRKPLIFKGGEELEEYFRQRPEEAKDPFTMVSQTTCTQSVWKICKENAKKLCTNIKIFDTICNATYARQSEAQHLAAQSDGLVWQSPQVRQHRRGSLRRYMTK